MFRTITFHSLSMNFLERLVCPSKEESITYALGKSSLVEMWSLIKAHVTWTWWFLTDIWRQRSSNKRWSLRTYKPNSIFIIILNSGSVSKLKRKNTKIWKTYNVKSTFLNVIIECNRLVVKGEVKCMRIWKIQSRLVVKGFKKRDLG